MKSQPKEQNILSKAQLQKKATLLKHKILTNASITHNSYEYRIQHLLQQQKQIKAQLNQLLKKLILQVQSFGKNYKSDIQHIKCLYFGSSDPNRIRKAQSQQGRSILSSFVCAEQLKQYLNSQKKVLKQLLQNKQQSKGRHQTDKLHSLVRTKHLQQILEKVQLAQLQKEVKYLSTHVINSSGLIYVPEAVMGQAEQQQLNKKLQLMISQIQRLVTLEVVCSAAQNNRASHKTQQHLLIALQNQQKRLKRVSQILKHEKQCVEIKEKSIQKYFNISNKLPLYRYQNNYRASNNANSLFKVQKPIPKLQKIKLNQLHLICDGFKVEEYKDIVSSQVCQIQELITNLKFLRNKIIKIE